MFGAAGGEETRWKRAAAEPRLPRCRPLLTRGGSEFTAGLRDGGDHLLMPEGRTETPAFTAESFTTVTFGGKSTSLGRLRLTPPSSPSGLSSDGDREPQSCQSRRRSPFSPFLPSEPPQKPPAEPPALTCRGTSPCRRRTRS